MRKIVVLCLILIGFIGFGTQDVLAQNKSVQFDKVTYTKVQEIAHSLKLESDKKEAFYKILDKHYSYLERNKEANDFSKTKAKITKHTEAKMKALLSEDQYIIFKKAIL